MIKPIYFDNAATAPLDPRVIEVMNEVQTRCFGNSQSSHIWGWEASHIIEEARLNVQKAIQARKSQDITFTSGATESNNWLFQMLLTRILKNSYNFKPQVIISAGEHASVTESAKFLEDLGLIELIYAPLNSKAQVDFEQLKSLVSGRTILVSVMWVQNEIGAINPIKEISEFCYQKGIEFHTDATQALGRLWLNVKDIPITFLSASAHKIYGPKGIGFLYHNSDLVTDLPPLLKGGGHESGRRSGTVPTPLIAGLGEACRLISTKEAVEEECERISRLRSQLAQGMLSIFDDLRINSDFEKCVSTHLHVSWRKFSLPKVIAKIAASRGSACSSHKMNWLNPTLQAIGLTFREIQNSLRLTLGRFTTEEDIQNALLVFEELKSRVTGNRDLHL
jgi:cysteine desulfurase